MATRVAQPSAVIHICVHSSLAIGTHLADAHKLHTIVSAPVGGKFWTLYFTPGDMATHVAQPSAVIHIYMQTFIINNE